MRRLSAFVKRVGGGLELAKIAAVVVRLNHIAGSQRSKEAHLGITGATTLSPPKWHKNEAELD
jgi:hypothetical protein